jgi:hypothetical protein
LIPKVVRVEMPDEADRVRQPKKQVKQLQEALGKTQMQSVLNESFLQIACARLGMSIEEFKKKQSRGRAPRPRRKRDRSDVSVPDCGHDPPELLQASSFSSAA